VVDEVGSVRRSSSDPASVLLAVVCGVLFLTFPDTTIVSVTLADVGPGWVPASCRCSGS
jgi:hypothetical protein